MTAFWLFLPVVFGVLAGYVISPTQRVVSYTLSFSGAFLLATTLVGVLPGLFASPVQGVGVWMVGGVLLQIILEYISKGAEHGHVHSHSGIGLFGVVLGLFLHAFAEGLALQSHQSESLLWAILVHKLPVALLVFIALRGIFRKRFHVYLCMLGFALVSPLGNWTGALFSEDVQNIFLAVVAGMLLHVSAVILFESNRSHEFNYQKLASILLGFAFAYFLGH